MLYSLIPFVLVLSGVLPHTPKPILKKAIPSHLSKHFQYSVKKYKVNNVEYSRVPTKWKKEAVAD